MALISLNNLERFFNNLKTYISNALNSKANASHTHTTADISNLAENWNVTGTNLDISFAGSSNNNGQLSIQINGTDITTFMANQITNSTFNLNFNSFGYNLIPATDNAYNLGDSTYGFANFYVNKIYLKGNTIFNVADDNYICLGGATAQANGANIVLNGKNRSTSTGEFKLEARDGTNTQQLIGRPNGILSWSGNGFVKTNDTSFLDIFGSSGYTHGAQLTLFGQDINDSYTPGIFRLMACRNNTTRIFEGLPNGTLIWNGQAVQTTSDQRYKQQITQIDNALLDAWEDVEPVQFKYNEAVEEKGNTARLHTGYVVQQIDDACKKHNVDVSKYGLYCHEEYKEETREVENEDGTKETKVIRPASEHYSLRYTEALIIECAYLRKCIKELKEEIKELKNKD